MKALLEKIRNILRSRKNRQVLTRSVSVVAAVVVFVTTYALVLPAITMEQNASCGIPEHQHTDACYEEQMVCGIPEGEGHHHDKSCYEKFLICGLAVHVHSPECYRQDSSAVFSAGSGESVANVSMASAQSDVLYETDSSEYDPDAPVTDDSAVGEEGMEGSAAEESGAEESASDQTAAEEPGAEQSVPVGSDTEGSAAGEAASGVTVPDGSEWSVLTPDDPENSEGRDAEENSTAASDSGETALEDSAAAASTASSTASDKTTAAAAQEMAGADEDSSKSGTLTAEGNGYKITLDYTEKAKIPQNAELSVREITAETDKEAYEACLEQAGQQVAADDNTSVDRKASRFFDIEILVRDTDSMGNEEIRKIEPSAPVSVNIQIIEDQTAENDTASADQKAGQTDPAVLHFAEEGVEQLDAEVKDSQAQEQKGDKDKNTGKGSEPTAPATEISFEAESFSIYAVVYTVDFHWEVNGKTFDFSIPGGGFGSLEQLVEVLGINGAEIESESSDESEDQNDDAAPLMLEDLIVSEATKEFVADVESVEFSKPELVWVGKVEEETTVGGLKETNEIEVQYSAELTEEQIAEINAQTVDAGDWALISMHPFTSEETLTVTMKDGEVFTIRVTDASYTATKITDLDGKTGALVNNNGYNNTWLHNALQSSAHTTYGRLNAIEVTITDGKIDTTSGSLTKWKFQKVEGTNDQYYISASENEYLNINSSGLFVTSNPQALVVQSDSSNRIRIHLGDTDNSGRNTAVNCVGNSTANGYGTYKNNWMENPGEWFDFYEVDEVFPVTLHFVKEDGTSFAAGEVTYADGTPVAYADGNFKVDPSKVVVGSDGVIDLNQFKVNGNTLSNTHKSTIANMTSTNRNDHPHTIIGNELRWNNGTLQYKLYYTNTDKAKWAWFDVGYEARDWDSNSGNPSNPGRVADNDSNPLDYYLVYSPDPSSSSGGGQGGSSGGNLEEVGKSKTLTPNSDGTYTMELGVTTHAKTHEESNGINIIVLFDTSSSMTRSVDNPNTKLSDYKTNSKSRFYQATRALNTFLSDFCQQYNTTEKPDTIQLALVDFNYVATKRTFGGSDWTNNAGTFFDTLKNLDCPAGTNWAQALAQAETLKASADSDPTYVLLMTDGAPSQYWLRSDITNGDYFLSGQACYLASRDEARGVVNQGMELFGIFSYGDSDDENNDYLGELVDYAYYDEVRDTHAYYASDGDELKRNLSKVFSFMSETLADVGVNYNDGIALDTTSTALSNISGPLGSITYSKTGGSGTPYTVVVDSTGKAIFKIGADEPYTEVTVNQPTEITYTKISGSGENIQVNNNAKADVYQCTVGSGEDAVTYTMPIATLDINSATKEGDLNWDLSPLGFLEDNAEYKISFVVWPDQEAYDYVADLNNGKMQWNTSTQEAVYEVDGTTIKYYKNGVAKYPNIVYNPNTNKYAALTNTKQEVTYYVGSESTGTPGEQSGYSGQYETHPMQPDPMPLEASLSKIEKQWNVERDPKILAELLYGNKDNDGNWIPYSIRFGVHIDGKTEEYTSVTLGWETEWDPETNDYVWADEPWTTVPYGGKDHPIGKSWVKDFSIATGLMLSTERMNALGLDTNAYPKHFDYTDADGQTVTYYILEDGHDYTLEESPKMGYEFDFESPVFHPMLVDGKLQSVTFIRSEPDSEHPQGMITGIEAMTDEESGLSSLKVQNTLRGYINLKKVVVDEKDTKIDSDLTKFGYRIDLKNSEDVFEGDHIPWYGVNSLFYHDDSFNYYQAYVDAENNLKICTESGGLENPYDAVVGTVDPETGVFTPGGAFDPNDVTGQTLKFNDGTDRTVTIKGNRTTATDKKNAWAEMKISQNETLSIANVPHGTTYTIKEKETTGYQLFQIESNKPDNTTVSLNDSSIEGTVVANTNNDVTFTNKVIRGNLVVTKELLGDLEDTTDTTALNKEYKVSIRNSAGKYLQNTNTKAFGTSPVWFTVSAGQSLTISDLPIDTYTVTEKTDGGDMDIGIFNWNSQMSTSTGSAELLQGQTSSVELKNYYNETYSPAPSVFDVKENLAVNKTWENLAGREVSDDDEIKIKISVKSEEAYVPVMLQLYDGDSTLNALSKTFYVPEGSNVAFTMQRGGTATAWRRVYQYSSVSMYSDSGTPLTFSNTVPNTGGISTGGSNPTDNPVTYTARNVGAGKPVEYRLQPWKEEVDWISGDPTEQGQFNMRFAVTHNNTEATYYESVAAMRDALINEHTSSETLVYTMKKGQPPVLDTENSSSSVTPAEIDWTTGSWSAVFKDMPTYQRVNEGGKEIFRVYSYDIEEIQVNGQTVTDGKTDEYQVEAATGDPVTGQDGVVTTTTDITNTEMSIPVTLLKTDDTENSTNYLSGAIFELQYKKTSDGTWQKASKTEITQLNDLSRFTIPGDADGITLTGLKAGFYQLVEISPPIGYIITNKTPVAFEVKRGEISSTDGTVEGVRYTAKGADNDASFIIPNTPGVSLPHTGGPGTRLFTVLGAVLICLATAGLVMKRRQKAA